MNTLEQLRERLNTLEPSSLDIIDHSGEHAGHASAKGGAHFQLRIVSSRFSGLGTLARHRLIYQAAGELMDHAIHALSINAKAPEEVGV